ncbi:MAG: alpha/beta fold hydrolase [Bacteroidota bacterium]
MRSLLLLLSVVCLLASCQDTATKPVDKTKTPKQYTIEQFLSNTSIFGGSFSPDEQQILVGSNQTGIFNAYAIPVSGGAPQPLTNSEETVRPISYFPNNNRILFSSDNGGNEIFHIFMRDEEGTIKELTPDEGARAVFYGWSHDLKSFFYGSNKRDARAMDVYEMDIEQFESKMIYENSDNLNFGGISDDKQHMALTKSINTNDSDLMLYSFSDKSVKKISENQAGHSPADFSRDNKSLYYLTDDGAEFQYLVRYDLASGEREKVKEADWDIAYAYYSYTGKYRVTGINQDAKTVVEIFDTEKGQRVDFPEFTGGDITSVNISRSENKMSFYVGASNSTSNLYVYDFATQEYQKLTNTLNEEIAAEDLVEGKVVRYKSFDELPIPAILYKPKQASKANKVPALVWVHGGPGGQSRLNYSALIQYLVNHGYAILMVNNRGSSGYGKTFYRMDDQNHGEKDLKDCIEGKQYLANLDYVDKDKIGIIGGSYGGFMVMRALTHDPQAFEVGVNLFGVTNWLRTLKSIPPWWESFKDALYEEMGDPNQDSVRLYNISPLFHADKIEKPVMVLQGAKDPRVLQVESDEIVAAVKEKKVPVDYILFDDEGHGFVKKENQIVAYSRILQFVDKYLKNKEELKG